MRKLIPSLFMIVFLLWASSAFGAETQLPPDALQVSGSDATATVIYQLQEDGKLLISVTDAQEKQVVGLTPDYFSIRQGSKKAKIISFEPLATSKEIGLQIIMVIDNSKSMQQRQAVQPLTEALHAFFKTLRPIDTVTAVMFDEHGTISLNGTALHAKVLQTNDESRLKAFTAENLSDGLTEGTYLYDAMAVGLSMARTIAAKSDKFMVVFSDGEDINSQLTQPDLDNKALDIPNFKVFAVDYMPTPTTDPYLKAFADRHGGRIWKAASAEELLPVFEAFSSILLHRYVVGFRFNQPPHGTLAFGAPQLTIEEVTTIDSAPLLNHIYFEASRGELSSRYVQFASQQEAVTFSEKNLKGPMEKYTQVLNIIGARLKANPAADVRLVGCNANTGEEKGALALSRSRAESVRAYLRYIWGIDPQRMIMQERNLPQIPSTSRLPEGRAENQRVEILSDHPAILDTVNSEYVQKVSDLEQLRIVPQIRAEAGFAQWQVTLACANQSLRTFSGQGDPPAYCDVPLTPDMLEKISLCGDVRATVAVTDQEGNGLQGEEGVLLPLRSIQRKAQMAQVQGYRVKEQYALILFDFDKAEIKERNEVVVGRITERLQKIPSAQVSIVGHTDTIGKEAYNLALSQKRAEAVRQTLLRSLGTPSANWLVQGAGPRDPLYDNLLPEGRALNRTVTITLEYLQLDDQRATSP